MSENVSGRIDNITRDQIEMAKLILQAFDIVCHYDFKLNTTSSDVLANNQVIALNLLAWAFELQGVKITPDSVENDQ
jgi:hypothetical protein